MTNRTLAVLLTLLACARANAQDASQETQTASNAEAGVVESQSAQTEPETPADFAVPRGTTAASHRVTDDSPIYAGFEVFARYTARLTHEDAGTEWFHELDVPRVHAAIEGEWSIARARVVLEGVRSTSEGSLVGVAGESIVLRLREAWAQVALWEQRIELRGGIVPSLTIPAFESVWRMRAVAATPLEENRLAFAADLGATATLRLPKRYGWLGVGFYNGEGYTSRELNRGKTIEAAAELHPIASVDAVAPLGVFASYVEGSTGTGSARANRLTTGLLWRDAEIAGGAQFTYAWGLEDDASRVGWMVEGFLRGELFDALLLGARVVHFLRNDQSSDRITTLVGTVGYRIVPMLEAFFAVSHVFANAEARATTPGLSTTDLSLVARATY